MKLVAPAEKIRLKDDILAHPEVREWEFQRVEEGIVSLTHPGIRYTIGVKEDCIDWDTVSENGLKGKL